MLYVATKPPSFFPPATFFESVQFAKLADLLNQTRSIDIFEKGGMPIANMFLRNLLLKSAYACTSPSMRQPNPADRERTDRNMNLLSTLPSFRYGEIGGLWFDTLLCVADATGARLSAPFRSEFGVDTIDPTNLLVHQYPKKGADDWTGMTEKEQVLFRIFYSSVAVRTFDKVYWSNTRYCTDCFEHAFDGLGSDHCVLTASSPLQHRPAYNYENDASVQEWFGTKTLDVFKDETVNAALFSPFESRDTPADLPPIALANLRRVAHAILRAQNKDVEDGDVASDVITRVQNLACHNQLRVFEGSDTTLCTIVDSRAISLPSVLLRMCIDRSHPDKGDPLVNPHGFSFFLDDHKKSVFMFCDMSVPAVHEIDKAFPITWHTVNGHQQVIKTAWTFAEMFVVGAFCWPNDDQVIPWPFNLSFLAASHFLCRRFLTHTNLILEVIVATVAHDFVAAAFKYFTE